MMRKFTFLEKILASTLFVIGMVGAGTFVLPNYGGTGIDSSASTGVAQVASGTWSVSTALANGTTAQTQTVGDGSTKVATDAFVLANPSLTTCTQWSPNSSPYSSGVGPTTNATKLYDLLTPGCNLSVTKITYSIFGTDNTANLYDIGFYDSTGTLITNCHIGATPGTSFAPSSAAITRSFVGTCVIPGNSRVDLAITGNASIATLYTVRTTLALNGLNPTAGNTTSGGVLNNSVTPPADAWNVSGGSIPIFAVHN